MSKCLSRVAALVVCFLIAQNGLLRAQTPVDLGPLNIHIAARTSFTHDQPKGGNSSDRFLLDSARLFLSGPVTKQIKLTLNTEYDGNDNKVQVMDAIGQFEVSSKLNFWVGRFLPPSDRANLYGPYYSNHWGVYTDGVQDGYPFIFQGRANGAAYWGQFGKFKLSGGGFDGPSATGNKTVIGAGRIQVDFWDAEPGYYVDGTEYGDKNILSLGVAGQVQGSDRRASNVDFLMERKIGGGGAFTIESELARYNALGGYNSRYSVDQGGYVLASYLLPKLTGTGRFEILGKVSKANFTKGVTGSDRSYNQKTTELNLNYIIKAFDARIMTFYMDTRFNTVQTNDKRAGVGIQLRK